MLKGMAWFGFFFQAEDGIRDDLVTGVQTCALPISTDAHRRAAVRAEGSARGSHQLNAERLRAGERIFGEQDLEGLVRAIAVRPRERAEIGRASCRERV